MQQSSISTKIVQQILSPEDFSSLMEKYLEIRSSSKKSTVRPITDTDRQIYADFKAKMTMSAIEKKHGMSHSKIVSSILRVTRE